MQNLLDERQNVFWHDFTVLSVAGASAGIGLDALPPVRRAIGNGFNSKTITLSCGKLTTGVTVPQWSSILMLRNLKSPETYFQAAFRIQSPWSIKNPNGNDPNEEAVVKPVCFVFDFAPTRALRQLADYGVGLSPNERNPEKAVEELVSFLPVLAYDGSHMTQVDAGGILDIAMAGTSATLLARKWESALLVNVDNETLRRILASQEAMEAILRIEGFRALGDNIIETIINKSDKVKELKAIAKDRDLTDNERRELTAEEREYKSKRKMVPGEAHQVCHSNSSLHVSHGLSRKHPPGRDHEARAGLVPCRDRLDGRRLPPPRTPEGLQHRADESGGFCFSALRRRISFIHGNRQS
jgi:hypothetical protein